MERTDRETPRLDRWLQLPADSLLTLLKGSCRLCMANLLPNNRISLLISERNGIRLLQMANDLTGLQISDQSDCGLPMDCCLSCAGKLVNFYEFREHCNQNEKEFDTIYTAIRLKLKYNNPSNGVQDDDDMQLIYVCRVCKLQFENNSEYQEHKKTHGQHNLSISSVAGPSNPVNTSNPNIGRDGLVIIPSFSSDSERSPATIPVIDMNGDIENTPVKLEPNTDASQDANPSTSYDELNQVNQVQSTPKTVPPLILHRRTRGSLQVVKATDTISEQINVDVNPDDINSRHREYKCDKCPMLFPSIRQRLTHTMREHAEKRKRGRPGRPGGRYFCKHCGNSYDNYIHKYRHEKQCLTGTLQPPAKKRAVRNEIPDMSLNETYNNSKTKCSKCHEEFSSSRAKTIHEKDAHNLDIRECRNCQRIFSSYPARYMHEKRCSRKPAPQKFET